MPTDASAPKTIERPRVLAIDVGSSSARSGIFDANLRLVESTFSQDTYSLITGHDGRAELDSDVLVDVVTQCLDRSLAGDLPIDCIGISCFWHSIMGIDDRGVSTTRVLTWADTRAASTVASMKQQIDETQHHQHVGTRLHSSYPVAKIQWLIEGRPDVAERTSRWISFPEYLQLRVFGRLVTSISMASGTGLFDRANLVWSQTACDLAGIDSSKLARIDDGPFTGLASPYAERWPGLRDSVWFPAIGDGAANNLGSDADDASHPALMVGTTGALRLMTDSNPPTTLPAGLWHYRLDPRRSLLGGALSEGGGVIAWLMRNLNLPDQAELERILASAEPDGHGLTVLPYLAGERSPGWHSNALGTIHGLKFDTRPIEIVQATMESIACSFAGILSDLQPLLEEPVEITATGNGLRMNRPWVQIIADVLGYPLLLPRQTEASLRGAAIHALNTLGNEVPRTEFASNAERFEPNPDHFGTYTAARERHYALYQQLVAGSSLREFHYD